jgi:hypothetical protein
MLARKVLAQDRVRHSGPPRRVRAAISTEHATRELCVGRLVVLPEHVVFVKGVVEASEGLASLFAERGGDLCIAAPHDRAAELRDLLLDLAADLGGSVDLPPAAPPR